VSSSSASKELIDELAPVKVHDTDYDKTGSHVDVTIEPDQVRKSAELLNARGYFLEDLTAVDRVEYREMVYRFNQHIEAHRITVRTKLGPEDEVDTISDIFTAANWQERECHEFLGVKFKGHPDLRRLLLPEDADFFPLRKDFKVPPEALAPEYHQEKND